MWQAERRFGEAASAGYGGKNGVWDRVSWVTGLLKSFHLQMVHDRVFPKNRFHFFR